MANEVVEETPWAQEDEGSEIEENGDIQISDNAQEDMNLSSQAPQTSGDLASPTDGPAEDAVGDYDPASVDLTVPPQEEEEEQDQSQPTSLKPTPQPTAQSLSAPAPASKKRKTAGGFLVGDSDSEGDDVPAPAPAPDSTSLPTHPSQAPQSLSDPLPDTSASVPQAQEAQAPSNVPSTSQPNDAPAASVVVPTESSGAVAPQFDAGAGAPYDVITTLEDRIKQEPRAAMDAWLDLIAELRQRNDIDALRDVYERFLAVFPQAVSCHNPGVSALFLLLTTSRRTFGLRTWKWRWTSTTFQRQRTSSRRP